MKLAVICEIDALMAVLKKADELDMTQQPPELAARIAVLKKGFDDLNEDYRTAVLSLHKGIDTHLNDELKSAYDDVAAAVGMGGGTPGTVFYSYSYSMSLSIPPPTWRHGASPMTMTVDEQ